jgi:hypothetical protein
MKCEAFTNTLKELVVSLSNYKNIMSKKIYIIIMLAVIGVRVNAQWQQTSLDSENISALAIKGDTLLAGTGAVNYGGNGVYLSLNNGNSWTVVNNGLPYDTISGWYYIPTLVFCGNNIFAGTYNRGVYKSSNIGNSWIPISTGLSGSGNVVSALSISDTNIFAGTYNGVYMSSKDGNSWSGGLNTGLTNDYVWSLAINDTNIYAGTANGVFLSSINVNNYTEISIGITNTEIKSLAIKGDTVFVGSYGGGVFFSTNNGSMWAAMNTGLTEMFINAFAISGNNIFVATDDDVFLYSNIGNNWTSTGLAGYGVEALAISKDTIFAGTDMGVWKCALSKLTGINELNYVDNMSVYPNPATNAITIDIPKVAGGSTREAVIEITRIQGQRVKTLATTGNKTNVDVSALPCGVYVIQVKSEKVYKVGKFVKE